MRPRVVIAGGYGLVGGQVARLLRAAGHDIDLVLAGRHPKTGEGLAAELGAETMQLDVADPSGALARKGRIDLVVATLQDPGDNLLTASLVAGAAHIGIVGTAQTMAPSAIAASALARRSALMLGHWQAGALTWATLAACRVFATVERIEMAALYDYADPIGPMTAADSGTFVGQALVRREGVWTMVDAPTNGRAVARGDLPAFDALPMGVLDTPGLAAVTGARDVRFDLGVGQSRGTINGGAASHDLYIDVTGHLPSGEPASRRTVLTDPAGQAHLTALGVMVGVERLLGLDGTPPPAAGLVFPETVIDPQWALDRFRTFGVRIEPGA